MNVDLELYRLFYVVAKNKNMTKASIELHISQPAISQSIKKLEDQLGGTLFLRSNKGMELTKEGKMFFDYVKGALELISNAEAEFTSFKDLSKGEIKIGCSTALTKIVLLDAIKNFHHDYPNIEIKIVNELTSHLLHDLQKGKLDFVIFNDSSIKENNVKLQKLLKLKQGFLYNPNYYEDKIKEWGDLNKYPLILQNKEANSRQYLDILALNNKVILKSKMDVVSQGLIIDFIEAGLGIGFTIIDLAHKIYPHLQELNINKDIPSMDIYIAQNKSINLTFASKTLLEYIKK